MGGFGGELKKYLEARLIGEAHDEFRYLVEKLSFRFIDVQERGIYQNR